MERDPLDVLRDVRNEFVSEKSAKEDYGVVVNVHNWTVNEEQTKELRSRINKSHSLTLPLSVKIGRGFFMSHELPENKHQKLPSKIPDIS